MKIIIDTHIFLWFLNNDKKLSMNSKELIEDDKNDIYISVSQVFGKYL